MGRPAPASGPSNSFSKSPELQLSADSAVFKQALIKGYPGQHGGRPPVPVLFIPTETANVSQNSIPETTSLSLLALLQRS